MQQETADMYRGGDAVDRCEARLTCNRDQRWMMCAVVCNQEIMRVKGHVAPCPSLGAEPVNPTAPYWATNPLCFQTSFKQIAHISPPLHPSPHSPSLSCHTTVYITTSGYKLDTVPLSIPELGPQYLPTDPLTSLRMQATLTCRTIS